MIAYPVRISDPQANREFRIIVDQFNALEQQTKDTQNALATLHVPTIAEIQKELGLNGTNPLNITGLQGLTLNPQASAQIGTHAQRLAAVPVAGTFWIETDRTVVYIAEVSGGPVLWVYADGRYTAAFASRPADLGSNDAGFLFLSTDSGQHFRWTGAAWVEEVWNASSLTGLVGVANGGTGVGSLTTNGVLYGGTTAQVTAQGPANSVLTANAGAPVFSATPQVVRVGLGVAADSFAVINTQGTISSGVVTNAAGSFYAAANAAADTYIADCASSTGSDACDIKFQRSGGTQASRSAVADTYIGGDFLWNFWDGSAFRSRADIQAKVNGTVSGSTIPVDLVFKTGSGGVTEAFRLLSDQTAKFAGLITNYNSIATKANGVAAIYGQGRATGQAGANASVAAYTVGTGADGSFLISANILITAFTAGTVSVVITYTDEGNTARSLTMNLSSIGGVLGTTAGAAGAFEGIPLHIRAKANTAITVTTTVSIFTGTYNVEGYITQIG